MIIHMPNKQIEFCQGNKDLYQYTLRSEDYQFTIKTSGTSQTVSRATQTYWNEERRGN